ncbi:hypothetical protein AHAS_Ahas17G0154500 [Arachis hypogaea]
MQVWGGSTGVVELFYGVIKPIPILHAFSEPPRDQRWNNKFHKVGILCVRKGIHSFKKFLLQVLVECLHFIFSSKSTMLIPSIRNVTPKYEIAVDPNNACTNGPGHCVCNIQILCHNSCC